MEDPLNFFISFLIDDCLLGLHPCLSFFGSPVVDLWDNCAFGQYCSKCACNIMQLIMMNF